MNIKFSFISGENLKNFRLCKKIDSRGQFTVALKITRKISDKTNNEFFMIFPTMAFYYLQSWKYGLLFTIRSFTPYSYCIFKSLWMEILPGVQVQGSKFTQKGHFHFNYYLASTKAYQKVHFFKKRAVKTWLTMSKKL